MKAQPCVLSLAETGPNGLVVTIECSLSNSLPNIVIVGYVSRAVDEARERIRSSFTASKLNLPRKRIIVNLAPADIPKEGTSFDLSIAAAILAATSQIKDPLQDTAIIGELGLDGTVRPVRGIIGKLLVGKRHGLKRFIIPTENLAQAALLPGIHLAPVATLTELYQYLNDSAAISIVNTDIEPDQAFETSVDSAELSLDDVIGQELGKRAVEISAAGGHNLLLGGPPGTGKSMLAKILPSLLPPLSREEMLEVTHLHSLASSNFNRIVHERPFRSPHHSASNVAIVGGGSTIRPGEMSLSHHGVLLFDELPEFNRVAIEALRQPLETRTISIARAKDSTDFPANFIFVGTANPCPCGYHGTSKTCRCLPYQLERYRRKLSGPILDRIDLYVDVHEIDNSQLLDQQPKERSSRQIQERIIAARAIQAKRFGKTPGLNAEMSNRDIQNHAQLQPDAKRILDQAASSFILSALAYLRTVKVALTIADLDTSEVIQSHHIAEALQYRPHSYHDA